MFFSNSLSNLLFDHFVRARPMAHTYSDSKPAQDEEEHRANRNENRNSFMQQRGVDEGGAGAGAVQVNADGTAQKEDEVGQPHQDSTPSSTSEQEGQEGEQGHQVGRKQENMPQVEPSAQEEEEEERPQPQGKFSQVVDQPQQEDEGTTQGQGPAQHEQHEAGSTSAELDNSNTTSTSMTTSTSTSTTTRAGPPMLRPSERGWLMLPGAGGITITGCVEVPNRLWQIYSPPSKFLAYYWCTAAATTARYHGPQGGAAGDEEGEGEDVEVALPPTSKLHLLVRVHANDFVTVADQKAFFDTLVSRNKAHNERQLVKAARSANNGRSHGAGGGSVYDPKEDNTNIIALPSNRYNTSAVEQYLAEEFCHLEGWQLLYKTFLGPETLLGRILDGKVLSMYGTRLLVQSGVMEMVLVGSASAIAAGPAAALLGVKAVASGAAARMGIDLAPVAEAGGSAGAKAAAAAAATAARTAFAGLHSGVRAAGAKALSLVAAASQSGAAAATSVTTAAASKSLIPSAAAVMASVGGLPGLLATTGVVALLALFWVHGGQVARIGVGAGAGLGILSGLLGSLLGWSALLKVLAPFAAQVVARRDAVLSPLVEGVQLSGGNAIRTRNRAALQDALAKTTDTIQKEEEAAARRKKIEEKKAKKREKKEQLERDKAEMILAQKRNDWKNKLRLAEQETSAKISAETEELKELSDVLLAPSETTEMKVVADGDGADDAEHNKALSRQETIDERPTGAKAKAATMVGLDESGTPGGAGALGVGKEAAAQAGGEPEEARKRGWRGFVRRMGGRAIGAVKKLQEMRQRMKEILTKRLTALKEWFAQQNKAYEELQDRWRDIKYQYYRRCKAAQTRARLQMVESGLADYTREESLKGE